MKTILPKLQFLRHLNPLNLRSESRNLSSYITTQQQLDALVSLIRQKKIIAIDTEFTRQTTYYPILSIIQVAVKITPKKKEFFIIDYLSDLNMSGFFQLMSDPKLIKIIHSSSQDLQIIHRESGLVPHGIIDTQIMANFCGIGFNLGYSRLAETFLNKTVDKKQQNSDWQQRPLSKKQINYAMIDVSFLEEIYEKLFEIIERKGRVEWYSEEIKDFTSKSLFRSDEHLTRKISLKGKSSEQIFRIKNLISWREEKAQEMDIPRQYVLRDEAIEALVSVNKNERHFPRKLNRNDIEEIVKILDMEIGDQEVRERHHVMTFDQKKSYEEAKKIVQKIAEQENIETQFLISAPDLKRSIYDREFFSGKVSGWRYQLFGTSLENIFPIQN